MEKYCSKLLANQLKRKTNNERADSPGTRQVARLTFVVWRAFRDEKTFHARERIDRRNSNAVSE
ncbi:hypothetical protein WN55_05888 [Dufourea novaeangliae]|uniref:Uncharacterized protein n=1 Tax=Dufourea novaeangliae TaxID=178035 RepID=A0A154PMV0_DUFNO|nr:hypothetical protein WN55_05888 [Dufourea novaeangliae]